jgi:hypothetical protein
VLGLERNLKEKLEVGDEKKEGRKSHMTVSSVSNVNSVYQPQGVQRQAPSSKSQASSKPTDSVQLSPAAKAQLKGVDADHDGDSH